MNIFKKFFRWLLNLDRRERYVFPLDEDVTKDKTIQELVKKLQSQDAQISNILAQEKRKKDNIKEDEIEQEKIKEVLDLKQSIENRKFGNSFSFLKFYKKYLKDKKFRKELEVVDKDDSVSFGTFGDFVVTPESKIGIINSDGHILAYGKNLSEVIYKPNSLGNQMKRKRIVMPCDKNGIFYPDIEEIEIPECTYDDKTGKVKWAQVREAPLRQLIVDREVRISELNKYIERLEKAKSDLVKTNREIMRDNEILKNNKNVTEAELSKANNIQREYFKKLGDLQNRIEVLTGMKQSLEDLRVKLENVNKRLIEKVEEVGAQTQFKRVLATVQDLVEWSRIQTGDTYINPAEEDKIELKPKPMVGGKI